jgi:hypothetical protein
LNAEQVGTGFGDSQGMKKLDEKSIVPLKLVHPRSFDCSDIDCGVA